MVNTKRERQQNIKMIAIIFSLLLVVVGITSCGIKQDQDKIGKNEVVQNIKEENHNSENEEERSSESDEKQTEQVEQGPGTKGPFWKVSHNGNVVYLLGSIHVATQNFYPLHEKIEVAFEESTYLAVEADILNINPLETQKMFLEKATYPDSSTLQDHLTAELYSKLEAEIKNFGLDISMFHEYQPWYISMILDSFQIMELGYDPNLGIDHHFLKKANSKKEIIELEGIPFQIDLFANLSSDIQLKLLEMRLDDSQNSQEEMDQLVSIWKSGNAEELASFLQESGDDSEVYKQFNELFLDQRNIEMTNKIVSFLNNKGENTYFVIVGAAHYVGDTGIIKLLEDQGFIVEKQF